MWRNNRSENQSTTPPWLPGTVLQGRSNLDKYQHQKPTRGDPLYPPLPQKIQPRPPLRHTSPHSHRQISPTPHPHPPCGKTSPPVVKEHNAHLWCPGTQMPKTNHARAHLQTMRPKPDSNRRSPLSLQHREQNVAPTAAQVAWFSAQFMWTPTAPFNFVSFSELESRSCVSSCFSRSLSYFVSWRGRGAEGARVEVCVCVEVHMRMMAGVFARF